MYYNAHIYMGFYMYTALVAQVKDGDGVFRYITQNAFHVLNTIV